MNSNRNAKSIEDGENKPRKRNPGLMKLIHAASQNMDEIDLTERKNSLELVFSGAASVNKQSAVPAGQ